jgi:hypothetical protein
MIVQFDSKPILDKFDRYSNLNLQLFLDSGTLDNLSTLNFLFESDRKIRVARLFEHSIRNVVQKKLSNIKWTSLSRVRK